MANTVAFHDRPGIFARISAAFAFMIEVMREAYQMRAAFGPKYDE